MCGECRSEVSIRTAPRASNLCFGILTGLPSIMPGYGQRSSSPVSQSRERSDPTFAALRKSPLDVLIFFQNSRIAAIAPKAFELRERDELPDDIYFYVTLASYDPTRVAPPKGYLHRAKTYLGHEAAGTVLRSPLHAGDRPWHAKHHLQPDGRAPRSSSSSCR